MARQIQQKCIACARLSAEQAQALHGPDGDGCWNPKVCHRRRSHYRHRRDNNAKRRGERAMVKATTIAVELPPVALVYLYREKRQDSHLHALAVTVWRGDEKLEEIPAIHFLGATNKQVNQYLIKVLKYLHSEYGIKEFEPSIRLDPAECPLSPCPLKIRQASNAD